MNSSVMIRLGFVGVVLVALGLRSASVLSDPSYTVGNPGNIARVPLYLKDGVPPLNMLVMAKDTKNYFEAYNDASDLDGDGALDIGYQGWELKSPAPADPKASKYKIDYYGYFNSYACYTQPANGALFVPKSATDDKKCAFGQWSGDFLNYLTTSRMDALRRVLYGGWRQVDTTSQTVLQGAFFPQDGHSWGKEYQSIARDGYDLSKYAPYSVPQTGKYTLFAVTTLANNTAPILRVLRNGDFRVWNWLSIEGPVAGNKCFNSANTRVTCVNTSDATWFVAPAAMFQDLSIATWKRTSGNSGPANRNAMNALFNANAVNANRCGGGSVSQINKTGNNNPFAGNNGCGNDNYLTRISGQITVPVTKSYQFSVDGDDAVDLTIDGNPITGWYGGHGSNRGENNLNTYSATVNLTAGSHDIVFRHEEGSGDDNWGLLIKDTAKADGRDDYKVRVEVCPQADEALRDTTCKAYTNNGTTIYKPTGILHDYGETQKMYFGLITGSQYNNLEGGVLRRNISNFANEIDASTGIFRADVDGVANRNGIAHTIDRFRMIGGSYQNEGSREAGDQNWTWNTSNCPTPDQSQPLANGQCRMWGNPLAEMVYESMRYFAGAAAPTSRFTSANPGDSAGVTEEATMGLATETWKDPYATTGGNYPSCAKPSQTIISDINPSYDGDLPGSAFAGAIKSVDTTPASIAGFSASKEGQDIWNDEALGSRRVFIGEVGGSTDNAPTAKPASSFGNIRGLSPEEPSKAGTYYTASVARFARNNDLNTVLGQQNLSTYSVALASPLPRIDFPVGGGNVTLIPFAKTTSGTFGLGARKPTNTIVDFYVEKIANLPGQPSDSTINGGRPSAIFRINYEDSEQGNDFDMDAIVRYLIQANDDKTVTVTLSSEYAAGSADQNMGFVMSGTTQDGVYLEVKDLDSPVGSFMRYDLNTPNPVLPGGCVGMATGLCNAPLPTTSTRTFTPSNGAASATQLRDPLWYAAKYGAPNPTQVDANRDGVPDNYLLVTNPLNLRAQLSKAFDDIANQDLDVGVATISGARVGNNSFSLQPTYSRGRNGADWTGNLAAVSVNADGSLGANLWTATPNIPAAAARNIRTITATNAPAIGVAPTRTAVDFQSNNLGRNDSSRLSKLGIQQSTDVAATYGGNYSPADFVAYLRGVQTNEGPGTLRVRSSILGDIVNSEPVVASPRSDFGYDSYTGDMFTGYGGTNGYLSTKRAGKTVAYVGANDGMLHAFDASTRACASPNQSTSCAAPGAGRELFAFIPHAVLPLLGGLALPDRTFQHFYLVDGQITVGDAKQDNARWRTVAVASSGGGARSVFALDVTDPTAVGNRQVLWERNSLVDGDVGNVYGKPLLVPLQNDEWGVLFGNGYGGKRSDPSLYILDAFTGAVIKKLTANDGNVALALDGSSCGLVDVLFECNGQSGDPFNGLGQITAIDRNGDGRVDTVYGGDLQGNLWKFDLSADTTGEWKVANAGTALFTATTGTERQPITGGLRVAAGPGAGVMLYFGTGRYLFNGDNSVAANPQVQSLYAIFDNGDAVTGGRNSLVAQTIQSQTDSGGFTTRSLSRNRVAYFGSTAKRGWYLDLKVGATGSGERFIATPLVQSGRVFFTTYTPTNNSCEPGGANFQYGLDLLSGTGALANVTVLPNGTAACVNGDCGGVAIKGVDGSTSQPPVMGTGLASINPISQVSKVCDPTKESCATFEECQVVIYPGAFVLPRPCGRQSWRQLK